jgi:hypothetical protein
MYQQRKQPGPPPLRFHANMPSLAPLAPVALLLVLPAALATAFPAQRPITRQIKLAPMIERSDQAGTRDSTGSPGKNYWQQTVDYSIPARLDMDSAILHGTETITLQNTSSDTLLHRPPPLPELPPRGIRTE